MENEQLVLGSGFNSGSVNSDNGINSSFGNDHMMQRKMTTVNEKRETDKKRAEKSGENSE